VTPESVAIVHASVRCPLCEESVDLVVAFLLPGADTAGKWTAEVEDGYLRQHMDAEHN